jgi:hypothetical protein
MRWDSECVFVDDDPDLVAAAIQLLASSPGSEDGRPNQAKFVRHASRGYARTIHIVFSAAPKPGMLDDPPHHPQKIGEH